MEKIQRQESVLCISRKKGKAIQPSSWNENSHKRITEDKLRQQAGPDVDGVECWPDGFGESLKFLIWVVM